MFRKDPQLFLLAFKVSKAMVVDAAAAKNYMIQELTICYSMFYFQVWLELGSSEVCTRPEAACDFVPYDSGGGLFGGCHPWSPVLQSRTQLAATRIRRWSILRGRNGCCQGKLIHALAIYMMYIWYLVVHFLKLLFDII